MRTTGNKLVFYFGLTVLYTKNKHDGLPDGLLKPMSEDGTINPPKDLSDVSVCLLSESKCKPMKLDQ